MIYYPAEKLKNVEKIVLKHHDQGNTSIGDHVINVLPTPPPPGAVLTKIKSLLEMVNETVDEALDKAKVDVILTKILAEIAKFYDKKPESLFISDTSGSTATEEVKPNEVKPNGDAAEKAAAEKAAAEKAAAEKAAAEKKAAEAGEGDINSSSSRWEAREDLMNKPALGEN